MLDSCIKHITYSWDQSTSECSVVENANYLTTFGDQDDGFGMTIREGVVDSSECCSYAINNIDHTSPLLWSCEKEYVYAWDGSVATKTIWALGDDGSKFTKIAENEPASKDEVCQAALD